MFENEKKTKKKTKNLIPVLHKMRDLYNVLLYCKHFCIFNTKFEFKVRVHCGLIEEKKLCFLKLKYDGK